LALMCKTVFTVVKSDNGVSARADVRNILIYCITVLFFYIFNFAHVSGRERRDIAVYNSTIRVCGGGFKVVIKTINYQFHNLRNTAPRRSIYGHRFCRLTKPPPPPVRRYCSFNLIPAVSTTDTTAAYYI